MHVLLVAPEVLVEGKACRAARDPTAEWAVVCLDVPCERPLLGERGSALEAGEARPGRGRLIKVVFVW